MTPIVFGEELRRLAAERLDAHLRHCRARIAGRKASLALSALVNGGGYTAEQFDEALKVCSAATKESTAAEQKEQSIEGQILGWVLGHLLPERWYEQEPTDVPADELAEYLAWSATITEQVRAEIDEKFRARREAEARS